MGWNRYARKADATTQQIVDELRAVGYVVKHIGLPVDIMVTHPSWPANTWRLLECKSPQGKGGKAYMRKDRATQQAFCTEHGVPYVMNGEEAIRYLIANRPHTVAELCE